MERIIDIPEDIYILQLIEAGKFSNVEKQNFYDMLNLFDFSFENQVDIKYLEELSKCNLVNNTYKNFIDKESSKAPNFIKEIKKKNKIIIRIKNYEHKKRNTKLYSIQRTGKQG